MVVKFFFTSFVERDMYTVCCVRIICVLLAGMLLTQMGAAAQDVSVVTPRELKKLSVEELMNVEVSLVSRSPQKLAEAASAVQVITGEDIRNSGATNIADALRLVTNLQVAQLRSNAWLISSRGFNSVFSNKLLVMIDGRTVYSPLYAGVFLGYAKRGVGRCRKN